MTQQNAPLKCCHTLEQRVCSQRVVVLFKDVLHFPVGQRAAKLQAVKFEGLNKNSAMQPNIYSASTPDRLDHSQNLTGHNFSAL